MSPVEVSEMERYISGRDITKHKFELDSWPLEVGDDRSTVQYNVHYGYLPADKQQLLAVVEASDLRYFPLRQLKAMVNKLQMSSLPDD